MRACVDIGADSSTVQETVQYEGWLSKRNSWGVEWWNQRYFVLRESELCYFEAETDKSPKVRLDMADFTLAYGAQVEDSVGKRHTLQLTIKRDRVSSFDVSIAVQTCMRLTIICLVHK